MIKGTAGYQAGTLVYKDNNDRITLQSTSDCSAFFSPELAAMFLQVGVSCFCAYNETTNKVEMEVYHAN